MFNLSDKELDRLSREAASQHEPGDQLMGPGAWERLEARLDQELGRAATPSPNPLRGIRRLPFQYAPVILLIIGVAYYAVKQYSKPKKAEPSGGPPLTVVKTDPSQPGQTITEPSSKNPDNRENSTPTAENDKTAQYPVTSNPADPARQPGGTSGGSSAAAGKAAGSNTPGSNNPSGINPGGSVVPGGNPAGSIGSTDALARTPPAGNSHIGLSTAGITGTRTPSRRGGHNRPGRPGNNHAPGTAGDQPGATGLAGADDLKHSADPKHTKGHDITDDPVTAGSPVGTAAAPAADESGPRRSNIRRPFSLRGRPIISDSALRAYTSQAPPKKDSRSMHINRSLQLGLLLAPDFTSVNSLAGDKPGSSIGITADYQFFNRLYLGTGVLFSKKNYTARVQDCQVPNDYFRMVGLHNVAFIKGSLNMLEIPLNLRYDFSVTGNTLFFASAGASSYIMLNQQSDYYYNSFGREAYRRFNYGDKEVYLLSAFNLSMGVETGISNSLSLLVAPYVKLPTRSIGFGEIRMNSVGINLALKFAPVLSRKRK